MYSLINKPRVNLPSESKDNFSMLIKQLTFFSLVVVVLSCDTSNHIRKYNLPKTKANNFTPTDVKKGTDPSGLIWEKPAAWIPSDGSAMRLASFAIPYSEGSGDLSVIQLNGSGGGIESNVNRWRRQLDLESQSWIEIEKNIVKKDGILGIYNFIKIINKKIDNAFLCAIIPTRNYTIFVKLSLKPIGITEIEDDFNAFCSSLNIHR